MEQFGIDKLVCFHSSLPLPDLNKLLAVSKAEFDELENSVKVDEEGIEAMDGPSDNDKFFYLYNVLNP
ncbi:hypothetical protein PQX77_016749 [Marasmius sp. AFHP31]|nr:hypothetical protein PQX77_016749 [Marasmius sp. AFHP31]